MRKYENLHFVECRDLLLAFAHRQFQQYDDPRFAGLNPTPKPIQTTILDGKSVLKLVVASKGNHEDLAYFDPKNSGALIRY